MEFFIDIFFNSLNVSIFINMYDRREISLVLFFDIGNK